ncbi:MAG: MBL fold metallo-hydrolase [Treponema sp.]|nr:MBL fold metallo-hydrolase [Treponema sp.]
MKLTFLGTGTSHGIPVIACDCPVCESSDERDKRLRTSVLISDKDTNILIDCGPEFRIQALKFNIKKIDSVLLTHSHADHLHGIDDLRVFACLRSKDDPKKMTMEPLNIYANGSTIKDFKARFDYLFKPVLQGGGRALVKLNNTSEFTPENPLKIGNMEIFPVPMLHGTLETNGYVIRKEKQVFAYLTDVSKMPGSSIELLQSIGKIDHLIIDGLRIRPHSTHFSFSEALEVADKINPRHTWLTHLCHETSHENCINFIKEHLSSYPNLEKTKKNGGTVSPAFDGLILE